MAEQIPPTHQFPVRFVTAASLFDGHDASINIMRRILQAEGSEVVHLGHDRSVEQVVRAAVQEDVQGIAISSYQGGHVEYFTYLADLLEAEGAGHVRIYGGGGGVIVAEEIALLARRGVRIFSPEDGQRLGLVGMISSIVDECDVDLAAEEPALTDVLGGNERALARAITVLEAGRASETLRTEILAAAARSTAPVLGITGTGGSGKSSLTDELLRRLRLDQEGKVRVAVIAVDPTRRRGGGALLGDRIRMNSILPGQVFFRSMATRGASEVPEHLADTIAACKAAGFDLVIVETPGIGQGDAGIIPFVDASLYVMTPEFGAASQLEKIDMLDFADVVAINKYERRGAEDARRDVSRQIVRNRGAFGVPWEDMPVFGTSAARFDDDGVSALYLHLRGLLAEKGLRVDGGQLRAVDTKVSTGLSTVVPSSRVRYLADVADAVRGHHAATEEQAEAVRRRQHLRTARQLLDERLADVSAIDDLIEVAQAAISPAVDAEVTEWPRIARDYSGEDLTVVVRDKELHTSLRRTTLSGTSIPRVAVPALADEGALVRYLHRENLPGRFPFTAGVFPFKREGEPPARMFAGEGDPFRTNRRFRLLSEGQPATRLSTAFDSVTLYGRDPDEQPDIYGKVGTSGVSIATLDDMKVLYSGFDLVSPSTSVSMTINGPAPTILAMFLNTAIDQQLDAAREREGRELTDDEAADVRAIVLSNVRGTVQADILKEDQGQNTCIFSTEFALRCMGDVQEYFIRQPGAELLLRLDLGLPHRRGGGEPHQPARVHPRERVHLRRGLPRARAEGRRLRAELLVLLLQRDRRRVHRDRPGGATHLGGRDARPLRRRTSAARSSSTTCRPPAARCTRRRWTSTTSARPCRRCARSTTTRTPCTPTPSTRPSRPRRPSRCAARSRSR